MLQPGEVLDGKYRIVRQIGAGGMGAVFEGEATRIHRRVAIKVLLVDSSNREMAVRFQLEAQAAGRIGSPHIVDVLDLGELPDGAHYMVMEYLDGDSLRKRIADRAPMPPAELYPILEQLLAGVAAAHQAGVVHRDLKPDNVFLVRQSNGPDFVKLLDFGISKFSGGYSGDALSLTRTGAVMGTPYYLAPEQANGSKAIDHRTDLFTLGVIFYECLTGTVPFSADTFNELLFRIVLEPPAPLRERAPLVDPAFAALIERSMQKDPNQRFQSALEMKEAFDAWARDAGLVHGFAGTASRANVSAALAAQQGPTLLSKGTDGAPPADSKTLEAWAKSGTRSEGQSALEEPQQGRSRRLAVAALGALGIVGVASAWFVHGSRNDGSVVPATVAPTTPTTAQAAASASALPLAAEPTPLAPVSTTEPVIEPAQTPSVTTNRLKLGNVSGSHLTTPAAPPHAAPPTPSTPAPSVPRPPAPAAAADSDVSRIRGGRTIRTDL